MSAPLFTVFTPTFNRAATLPAVYDSLCQQTFTDFEWLVVDDGSTDNTAELVAEWTKQGRFAIRFFRQVNGGKHTAFNRGVREARGELLLPLDSDDTLVPGALDTFNRRWLEIPEEQRPAFSGITCQCVDERGGVVGTPLPSSFIDGLPYQVIARWNLVGERFGFHRTEVLRRFPFPVFAGERFVPEGLVWNRIGRQYKIRFVCDALRIYRQSTDGLSASVTRIRHKSPLGTTLYYLETLDLDIPFTSKLRNALNAWRFASCVSSRKKVLATASRRYVILGATALPGTALALTDKWRFR